MFSPLRSQVLTIEDLRGPAGRLEAILNTGRVDAPYAALIAHPHPPSGGTMHNKVVFHATKALSSFGLPVLRFNFRGTGLSEGTHDHGTGEQEDVRAAIDYLHRTYNTPILVAGFSFGANVAFRAACSDPRVQALIGLGLPVRAAGRDYTYGFLPCCTAPKLFITGTEDQFGPPDVMEKVFATAPEPKTMVWIEGAEHFFQGVPSSPTPKLDQMKAAIRSWLTHTLNLSQPA